MPTSSRYASTYSTHCKHSSCSRALALESSVVVTKYIAETRHSVRCNVGQTMTGPHHRLSATISPSGRLAAPPRALQPAVRRLQTKSGQRMARNGSISARQLTSVRQSPDRRLGNKRRAGLEARRDTLEGRLGRGRTKGREPDDGYHQRKSPAGCQRHRTFGGDLLLNRATEHNLVEDPASF